MRTLFRSTHHFRRHTQIVQNVGNFARLRAKARSAILQVACRNLHHLKSLNFGQLYYQIDT